MQPVASMISASDRPAPAVHARQLADLHFVAHVIAAHEQHVHAAVRPHHQALHRARQRQMQQFRDFLARRLARRGHAGHRLGGCRSRRRRRAAPRPFRRWPRSPNRCCTRSRPRRNRPAPGTRTTRAADRARIGVDGAELQSHSREDARVGVVHDPVRAQHRASSASNEYASFMTNSRAAHHAEARPDLVAELGLDLVEVDRQLPVAADLPAHDVGDRLPRASARRRSRALGDP